MTTAVARTGRPRRAAAALAVAVTVAVVGGTVTACGDDGPEPLPAADSFAAGTCQTLAPDLIETLRLAEADHSAPDGIGMLARDLVPSQERLYAQIGAAGEYAADLERVTTAVGFLRLRVDQGTYEGDLLTEVTTSARALVDRCT